MLFVTEQKRRMRGGAQAHLMRCSDGHYYIVKFQNNLQHRRILVNELLGTRLAVLPGRQRKHPLVLCAGFPASAPVGPEFTFPGDAARLDYSYRRNGTRGLVHTLSVARAALNAKALAYNVKHIADKARYHTEFAAVTDVWLAPGEARLEPVPREGLAVWVAKQRPSLLQ